MKGYKHPSRVGSLTKLVPFKLYGGPHQGPPSYYNQKWSLGEEKVALFITGIPEDHHLWESCLFREEDWIKQSQISKRSQPWNLKIGK
jgi:hypothetical protein